MRTEQFPCPTPACHYVSSLWWLFTRQHVEFVTLFVLVCFPALNIALKGSQLDLHRLQSIFSNAMFCFASEGLHIPVPHTGNKHQSWDV